MTIRRLLTLVAAAVAATVPITATAAPAHAAAPVDYVALGDSYSSGVGAPPYLSGGCSRSNNSYAAQWAATHGADHLILASRRGPNAPTATTQRAGSSTVG